MDHHASDKTGEPRKSNKENGIGCRVTIPITGDKDIIATLQRATLSTTGTIFVLQPDVYRLADAELRAQPHALQSLLRFWNDLESDRNALASFASSPPVTFSIGS